MSSNNNISLTIVIPFFNKGKLFGEMIESILNNDFQDYELLAVDDGSSPETVAYINSYAEKNSRIRIITRTEFPKGAPTCRNIGLREAQGEYIVFFDSDDYITSSCLSTRVTAIKCHHDLDFMIFPSGVYIKNIFYANANASVYGYDVHKDVLKSFARRELPFIVCTNIYRTSSLKRYNIKWDQNLLSLQDADFNIQSIMAGMKFEYAEAKADYGYRISYGSETVSQKICSEEHFKSHIYATEKFFRMFQNVYGHKYDKAILQGAYCLYNRVYTDGINHDTVSDFVKCIRKYNKWFGIIFKMQVNITCVLECFLPAKRARQIPMALYLVCHYWRRKVINKNSYQKSKKIEAIFQIKP